MIRKRLQTKSWGGAEQDRERGFSSPATWRQREILWQKRFWLMVFANLSLVLRLRIQFLQCCGFRGRGLCYWDSTLRVRIGNKRGWSTSGLLFGAGTYCGLDVVYFGFGLSCVRPFAILVDAPLCMSVTFFFRGLLPRGCPLNSAQSCCPGISSQASYARSFFPRYCVGRHLSAPQKKNSDETEENARLFPIELSGPPMASCADVECRRRATTRRVERDSGSQPPASDEGAPEICM